MRVLNNKILIEKVEEEVNKTKSGIILTTEKNDRICKYKIIKIGDNEEQLKENDIIYVDRYLAQEIILDGDKKYVCALSDVILVEEKVNGRK